jgi:LPS sulfotransferase NodH
VAAQLYIVAATPRTGSSLLCEGLWQTGIAGRPDEVFAPDFRHIWYRRWRLNPNLEFASYVRAVFAHGTTSNNVFGFKIQWMHVRAIARDAGLPPNRVLDVLFPGARFVNITRRDRHAQALSWHRAEVTGEWWRFRDEPAAAPVRGPNVDFDYIGLMEEHIAQQQAAWEEHFALRGITPLTIEYEVLSQDYRREVGRVLDYLGLDPSPAKSLPEPRRVRQSPSPVTTGAR